MILEPPIRVQAGGGPYARLPRFIAPVEGDVEPLIVEGENKRLNGFLEICGHHRSKGVFFGLPMLL